MKGFKLRYPDDTQRFFSYPPNTGFYQCWLGTVGSGYGSKEPNQNQVLVLEPGGHRTGYGGVGVVTCSVVTYSVVRCTFIGNSTKQKD